LPLQALALADDVTGALEIGAQLTSYGVRCAVSVDAHVPDGVPAAVLNLATRHMDSQAATAAVTKAATYARDRHIRQIYLKTDSTLRGRISESIRALLEVFPEQSLTYVPAYPAQGRTVRDGRVFVHGVPVDQTSFANDPLNPVTESHIPALVGSDRVIICDGETERDLATAARALCDSPAGHLVAGTGAFARYWASLLTIEREADAPHWPRIRKGLVASGSRQKASRPPAAQIPNWTILRTPDEPAGPPLEIATHFAARVRDTLALHEFEALVIFGGDTTLAILNALHCREAHPLGELLPGVPVSQVVAMGRSFTLVTKAGGFGGEQSMAHIIELLERG
jgi:D-threonate/D-erythronate kinase